MVAIAASNDSEKNHLNRNAYKWETITESDTPDAVAVSGGKYSASVIGTFGGGSIEFQWSPVNSNFHSIDSVNLSFSADGLWNMEVARGFIKPVRTGGSSMDVDAYLSAIPSDTV